MFLATMLLMLSVPQTGDIAKAVPESQAAASTDPKDASAAAENLPVAPAPKADLDGPEMSVGAASSTTAVNSSAPGIEGANPTPGSPNASSLRLESMKVAFTRPRETSAQRKEWYAMLVTSHAAAGFDAWSTRRAVALGYTEANPVLRPFANSNAIYVATQVSPVVMDYLGKRMMVSRHGWIRRMWWLPQAAGTGFSIGAGVHNVGIVH